MILGHQRPFTNLPL